MSEKRINYQDLRVERLSEKHTNIIKGFEVDTTKPDEVELKKFLNEDALINQEQDSISKTYLVFYNPTNTLIGYISLMSDSINVKENQETATEFRRLGIYYHTLPAIKIGRMCVSKSNRRKGIGTFLLLLTLKRLLDINERVACRFLVTDAKKDAVYFYKTKNFRILKERKKGTVAMYFDAIAIINLIKKRRQPLSIQDIK